jgi:hypothetical protein
MACSYGNCNDANCAGGADSDVNGNPCDDASCPPCGASFPAGSTVNANPSVPPTSSTSSASSLSQLGATMGQWGATIAGIATGTPTVVTPTGARTGVAAVAPITSNPTSMLLILGAVVLVAVIVLRK